MAYEPIRKYGDKDKLPSGDPGKVIYGAELDEEFSGVSSDLTSLDEFKEAQLESNQNAYDKLVEHELYIEAHEKRLDELDGGNEKNPLVGKGDKPGDTLYWDEPGQSWVHSGSLQVHPGFGWSGNGDEVEINAELCVNPMRVEQSTGNTLGMVDGRQGFQLRAYRFDNANDPWSGTTGATWEILGLEPRDNGAEPERQNGIDLTADRVTMRVTADWAATDWHETQIVFRADGEELELGSRKNPQTVKVNGNLTCSNSTELGDSNDDQHTFHGDVYVGYTDPNNVPDTALGDATPGTLFLSRGVKLVQDPAATDNHIPSFNAGGFKVVNLAPGVYKKDSVNFEQFDDFKTSQLQSNENVYDYLVRMELILQGADSFAEYKRDMLANLRSTIESMEP